MNSTTANETQQNQIGFTIEGSQYLTFSLGQEHYAVEILKVQEIKGYSPVTPIPSTPHYVKGVMNLRGTIVPVVDLRARLSMEEAEYNRFTVIIVVTIGDKVTGLIVDSVSDVVDIPGDAMRAPPDMGTSADNRFVKGMAKVSERLLVLLDEAKLVDFAGCY
ncbi:MAG: purine-binding chemotaxis protein CheW [Planctomycetes bacterium]|nr:purine-binding chemotaxis protein CheW [Planctomycetota bacterium]